jgi:hypothetical protein
MCQLGIPFRPAIHLPAVDRVVLALLNSLNFLILRLARHFERTQQDWVLLIKSETVQVHRGRNLWPVPDRDETVVLKFRLLKLTS